jgi:hypothetical protein
LIFLRDKQYKYPICRVCELPVWAASMGGYDLCPACDCGMYRNGEKWSYEDSMDVMRIRAKAKQKTAKDKI